MLKENNRLTAKAYVLPIILAFLVAIPAVIIGQSNDDPTRISSTIDDFKDTIDLGSLVMEQYVYGENYNDLAGFAVESAYVNNDMREDLIISAPGYNNSKGGVFIYYGWSTDRLLSLRDADVVIEGVYQEGYFGLDIEVGDVNGDGMVDILVSGFMNKPIMEMGYPIQTEVIPQVYLFMGESSMPNELTAHDASVTFLGSSVDHAFGYNIEIGDITDDGYDDVVISEYMQDGLHAEGSVYIWEGNIAMEPLYNLSLMEYDHRIFTSNTETEGGYGYWGLGSSDLAIGDINGDSYMDIMIGSHMINSNGMNSGEVEVLFGSDILPAEIDLMSYSHVQLESFPGYGLEKVSSTDFNGDGIADLIVTSPNGFYDHKGGAFIYYGDVLFPTGELSLLDYDFLFRGPYSYWGFDVRGVPDMNNDGRGEVLILSEQGIKDNGKGCYAMVYSSSTDDLYGNIFYMQFEEPDFVITASGGNMNFAGRDFESITFLDYYGDGMNEIVVGSPFDFFGENPPTSGIAYFYYQKPSEIQVRDFHLLDADGPSGNILGAGKVYHFEGYVRNSWDFFDFRTIDVKFMLHGGANEGKTLKMKWDKGLMKLAEEDDPNDFIVIESSAFNPDDDNGMMIYFNLSFNPTMTTEEPIDLLIDIVGGRDLVSSLSYPSLFKVEPDLDFMGDLTIVSEKNGVLSKGSYVGPGEKIEVTGITAVYQGTEAYPPNDYFGIQMIDNIGNIFLNTSTSGKEIYFTYMTQDLSGREEINISFVDLTGEADNVAGLVSFFYFVDTDLPNPPEEVIARADSDIDTLIGFDNDPEVFITWEPGFDETSEIIGYMYSSLDGGLTDEGTFTQSTQVKYDGLVEGWNQIFVWSVDSARNYGPSQVANVFYDTDMPAFGTPNPGPGAWVNSKTVNYEMTITDEDGSGVRGSTVEYAISYDGGRTYSAWEPTNIRNEGEQITVKVFLNFREGEDNFIKWRSKDIAGNGYILSDPFQVKIDTVDLSYKEPYPTVPVDENYVICGITLSDSGSGIDASTIEYSISYDSPSNYGPWEELDLSGSSESIDASTPPIYFEKDTLNYIKWRAKDVAGNGYIYSEDLPIDIKPEEINRDPVAIISYPQSQVKYLESKAILFDGSFSTDPDEQELKYLWYSDKDGYLGTDPVMERYLSQDNHLITLHVFDGLSNKSISVEVSVIPDPTAIDTDGDDIPDFNDDDDDNDGLLDIQEDKNKNGLFEPLLNETDPKKADTDNDGFNDRLDLRPLDPAITEAEDERNIPLMVAILIFVLVVISVIVAGLLFIMKMSADKRGMDSRRKLKRTRRSVKRFEVLTGVPTNDLPAIEAVQWALPAVINEASEFALEPPKSDDLLPESPEETKEEEAPGPDLDDMEVPGPAPAEPQVEAQTEIPGPEAPAEPEPAQAPSEGGRMVNCSLCGSEIAVEEGAASVECPLCGEINNL